MASVFEVAEESEKVILIGVSTHEHDDTEESIEELKDLVRTAGAVPVATVIQNRETVHSGTYIGKGKIEEVKLLLAELDATGIVCDDELSPAQLTNLRDMLDTKVMDRTLIILDIFAARASTSEGKIQVELAQLKYRQARLVGLRNSLSRLGGGIGTRGPGEKKLEMDRRLIKDRISVLRREVVEMKTHRELARRQRSKNPSTVVSIVGYTNAGKSTLLNHLTKADVLAEDKLFATLDPTTRALQLPSGQTIMLTDTVGFISRLPHHLIQAFRSTLEEAKYSDLILHVVDASNQDMDRQMHAVYETLRQLEIEDKPVITVFNKKDKLPVIPALKDLRADATVFVSAKNGEGFPQLLDLIEYKLRESRTYVESLVFYEDAALLADIRRYGQLLSEEYKEEGIYIKAYVRKQDAVRLRQMKQGRI